MKFTIYLTLILFFFCGCAKTENKKQKAKSLNELIEVASKETLIYPETYVPGKMVCDTLKYNMFNNECITKANRIMQLAQETQNLQNIINKDMETQDMWKGKNEKLYNEYSEKVRKNVSRRMQMESEWMNILNGLQKAFWKDKKENHMYGYVVVHTFNAKDNKDELVTRTLFFILDKTGKEVIASYDPQTTEMQNLMKVYDSILELGPENISDEEINIEKEVEEINALFE